MDNPTTQVEISVACRDLIKVDVSSKFDPMCVLYVKKSGSEEWEEHGRTEMIPDTLNPDFVKKFIIDYYFQESQKLKFEIYNVDSPSSAVTTRGILGSIECTLGEVVSSVRLVRQLQGPTSNCGSIILSAEELSDQKDEITLQFSAVNLDKNVTSGKSESFLQFSRSNENESFTVVHKTEVIKMTQNALWKPFTLMARTLCNGDQERVLKVECFNWNSNGSQELIGEFFTTVRRLRSGPGPTNDYPCVHPKQSAKNRKDFKNSAIVKLVSCKFEQAHTFLDYIQGGTQVQCIIAVDFTASNGDPRSPESLHYNDPRQPNLYARALRSVGEILQDYDSDKRFPAFGFGAKLPDGRISHEFPLNGNVTDPDCPGIDGVLEAYHKTLNTVKLHGPTNFAPIINNVARMASQGGDSGRNYFILLILTDGIITDMPLTCEAIVDASSLPLSIIIVGIGNADFDAMNVLDGDDDRLSFNGRYAERDIVQFVQFRHFIDGRYGNDLSYSQVMLAKEVLAEIPEQFISYMKTHDIIPSSQSHC